MKPADRSPGDGQRLNGLGEALAGFGGGYVLSAVAVAVATGITGYKVAKGQPIPLGVLGASLCGLWVGLVGAAVVVSHRNGTGSLRRDYGLSAKWWDVPLGLVTGPACQFGLIPLLYWPFEQFDKSLSHQLSRPAQADTGSVHTVGALVVILLLIAVGSPLFEELFFRGLLLRTLMKRVGPPLAIVITGLLFALAHFEAVQFAGLAVFGIVLGVLAWRTQRLAASIAAHMAFNASAVISLTHLH